MTDDERAIRDVVDDWLVATQAGDVATLLDLMTEDVVFLTPGQEPFGKQEFAAASKAQHGMRIDASGEVVEARVLDGWAFVRARLDVTVTRAGSEPARRRGDTLSILRKEADGRWRIARDANLLGEAQEAQ